MDIHVHNPQKTDLIPDDKSKTAMIADENSHGLGTHNEIHAKTTTTTKNASISDDFGSRRPVIFSEKIYAKKRYTVILLSLRPGSEHGGTSKHS